MTAYQSNVRKSHNARDYQVYQTLNVCEAQEGHSSGKHIHVTVHTSRGTETQCAGSLYAYERYKIFCNRRNRNGISKKIQHVSGRLV